MLFSAAAQYSSLHPFSIKRVQNQRSSPEGKKSKVSKLETKGIDDYVKDGGPGEV